MPVFTRVLPKNVIRTLKYPRIRFPQLQIRNFSDRYSVKDLNKIDYIFNQANRDVYKKLNMAEFNDLAKLTVGRKLEDVDLREIFANLDTNKNQYIDKGEVLAHFDKGLTEQTRGNLAYVFCRFDKDYDEHIYLHELKEALFYLGYLHAGDNKVTGFFYKKDTDKDNRINYDEFVKIVKEDMPGLL